MTNARAGDQAGGGCYRGVRTLVVFEEGDPQILGAGVGAGILHLLLDATFRRGFKRLQLLGVSFDVFLLDPQLSDLTDLAQAFPQTQIILNHVGALGDRLLRRPARGAISDHAHQHSRLITLRERGSQTGRARNAVWSL